MTQAHLFTTPLTFIARLARACTSTVSFTTAWFRLGAVVAYRLNNSRVTLMRLSLDNSLTHNNLSAANNASSDYGSSSDEDIKDSTRKELHRPKTSNAQKPKSAQHIPGNLQERCIQTVGILAGESTGTTLDLRLELFLQAVGSLIRDFSLSTHMYIDNLAHIPLGDWQQAHPDIESPFTREEMMEYCAELQSRDDFEYLEDDSASPIVTMHWRPPGPESLPPRTKHSRVPNAFRL